MKYKSKEIDDSYTFDPSILELEKETFDGKSHIECEKISFFPNLKNIINNVESSVDINESLGILDSICYADGPRPNPNQLLHQTNLFNSIYEIISSTSDEYILFLCLHISVHLSLANSLQDSQFLNPEIFIKFIQLLNIIYSEKYHFSIYQAILRILLNISLDSAFSINIVDSIVNENFISKLSEFFVFNINMNDQILSYRIAINIAQLIYENDLIKNLSIFIDLIQPTISSLKYGPCQKYAIELLSYLFFNQDCCNFALKFNIIEMIKKSLETLPIHSIPDAFTAINSLIINCNLIDEFIDDLVINKAMNTIKLVDSDETHPFFTFIDSLSENHLNCLENYHIIQFLFDLTDHSLVNKRKSICILVNIIVQNWPKYPKSKPKPTWMIQALILIIDNIYCLTSNKAEIVLNLLIQIHDHDTNDFLNVVQQTEFEDRLEDIKDIEDVSEEVLFYVQKLNDLVLNRSEKECET